MAYGTLYRQLAPIVAIQLFHDHAQAAALAFVDSGATYSIFQADIAGRLELSLIEEQEQKILLPDGHMIRAYLHRVGLSLADFQISAVVGFSKEMRIGFNLLGRYSIFNQLQFCFNDRDHELSVSPL